MRIPFLPQVSYLMRWGTDVSSPQACQVSKMDWSVIIRGARPSEAREFAGGIGGHAPPPGNFFENLGAISCILRLWKPYFIPFT